MVGGDGCVCISSGRIWDGLMDVSSGNYPERVCPSSLDARGGQRIWRQKTSGKRCCRAETDSALAPNCLHFDCCPLGRFLQLVSESDKTTPCRFRRHSYLTLNIHSLRLPGSQNLRTRFY